jgi:hypothetical protein
MSDRAIVIRQHLWNRHGVCERCGTPRSDDPPECVEVLAPIPDGWEGETVDINEWNQSHQ